MVASTPTVSVGVSLSSGSKVENGSDAVRDMLVTALLCTRLRSRERRRTLRLTGGGSPLFVTTPEYRAQWLPLFERLYVDEPDPEFRKELASALDNEYRAAKQRLRDGH